MDRLRPMQIVFRVDASSVIGTGHLMRCLTLAKVLSYHASVAFICREYDSPLYGLLEIQGFVVNRLYSPIPNLHNDDFNSLDEGLLNVPWQDDAQQTIDSIKYFESKPDWLVIDHYCIDKKWESALRDSVKNIMVIDDLANRTHDCDFILDQNYYVNMESRYDGLIPENCTKFLGPQYLLLRNEFYNVLQTPVKRTGTVNCILMFFGGSDATHETLKAIEALTKLKQKNIRVDVVVGQANSDHEMIQNLIESMPAVNYYYHIDNMAELMLKADLAVIAAGGSTWEACYLSLPVITIMTAENQFEAISSLGMQGVVWNLGWYYDVTSDDIAAAIETVCTSPEKLVEMGNGAKKLMGNSDGINKLLAAMKYTETSTVSGNVAANFDNDE